jgi:hypothetical protein
LSPKQKRAFHQLFEHAQSAERKTRPTKAWLAEAKGTANEIDTTIVLKFIREWLEGFPVDIRRPDPNMEVVRGLIWSVGAAGYDEAASFLGAFCRRCFTKEPYIGPKSVKLGNACLYALSMLSGTESIGQLTLLRKRISYPSARAQIDKALLIAAERAGVTPADLEEMGVPDFGLSSEGRKEVAVGDFRAEIAIVGSQAVELTWLTPAGKRQKTIPKTVKESSPDTVKQIKGEVKEVRAALTGQASRIERAYVSDRSWDYTTWRNRFVDQPLLTNLVRRLLWQIREDQSVRIGLPVAEGLEDVDGNIFRLGNRAEVSLWHPISSDVRQVLSWRRRLEEKEIVQPFKQAHREIYQLTDAERETASYSNRFAAHIIRQHAFRALCQQRDWRYALQGMWDSHNVPTRLLDQADLSVEFWVDPVSDSSEEIGVFNLLVTDQVRFHDTGGERKNLEDVPPQLFSEMMRDIDLFVGVCSVGNDPNWSDGGPNGRFQDYWGGYAFGDLSETAKTRRDVLENFLPKLGLAERCVLEDRYLVVTGSLGTYKIHLGSGNILMEPGNRYLCIVRDVSAVGKKRKVWLPFEGDVMLSVILSKAFLLADDHKITDATILSQIR